MKGSKEKFNLGLKQKDKERNERVSEEEEIMHWHAAYMAINSHFHVLMRKVRVRL